MHQPPPRYSSSRQLLPAEFDFAPHVPSSARHDDFDGSPRQPEPDPAGSGAPAAEENRKRAGRHRCRDVPATSREDPEGASGHDEPERRAMRHDLVRLAYGAGTGQDVADFGSRSPKNRFRLEGKALGSLAIALALVLIVLWGRTAALGALEHAGDASPGTPMPSVEEPSPSALQSVPATQDASQPDMPAAPAPPPAGSGQLVVYVSGAVASPGVYTLPAGARVNDAVTLAGGIAENAERALVNLAAPVSDGQHVHIAAVGETPMAAATGGGTETSSTVTGTGQAGAVNLNTATNEELQSLPGIGPALAGAVVAWREENGGFRAVEDLLEVSGIGQAKFAQLKDRVAVG